MFDRLRIALIISDIIAVIMTYFSGFEDGNNHLEKRNRDNNGDTAPMKIKNKELKARTMAEKTLFL